MDGSWKDITIGALIAQAIAAGWFYLRSIGDKVSKKDFEKAMTAQQTEHDKDFAALKSELEKTNAEMKTFARQPELAEMKNDLRRLEGKLESRLETIQQQLMTLLARDK
jgi:hypothetical protein